MPVRLATLTAHFRDAAGAEIPDATYTIRHRPSFIAQQHHAARAAEIDVDLKVVQEAVAAHDVAALNALLRGMSPEDRLVFNEIGSASVADYLLSLTGMEWEDGRPVAPADFPNFDPFYVNQVATAIQQLEQPPA